MKIIVDAYGGDNAPQEIVKGVVQAINAAEGFSVVLTGDESGIKKELEQYQFDNSRIEIVHAPEIITNDDVPTEAIRKKKNSSLVVAFDKLNSDEDAAAIISAGSTGAVLTGAMLLVKRIQGVSRAALAPVLPSVKGGRVVLIDCGANPECKASQLVQNAYMGAALAKTTLGIQNPKIGLLSNGTEDKKGNSLNKEVFPLLREAKGLNFLGNMEAREMLSGEYDVIVSDGFSGNIALKSCEGTALAFFDILKQNIMSGGLRAKIGFLLMKPVFKNVKAVLDYNAHGGAILLGLEKVVVKSHGSSKAKSIAASVMQAVGLVRAGTVAQIREYLKEV